MFPLWDVAIAPVLDAAGAKRVVEIGALRGETTTRMLDHLGPNAELHVIDPVPAFDPAEHERRFPGRYFFHGAPSLEVLPTLGPVDAALIDGDHNWFTVHNELHLLAAGAREAGRPLPVLILHDVLWPYGRRDLYYEPERIPPEHRQPYARRGMKPGMAALAPNGGLNPTMCNAELEGGPRNGVMTAVDDFVAAHPEPVRVLVLPIYFGLAIVVEEAVVASRPELAAALDRLEGADGRGELLEVAEEVRLRAMIFQHNEHFGRARREGRLRSRMLKVVKDSLLDVHYLDHEVRIDLLSEAVTTGRPPSVDAVRDPVRGDQVAYRRVVRHRLEASGPDEGAARSFLPYAAMGRTQLDHLEQCLDSVQQRSVPGDLVECGTGRGGGAIFMRVHLDAHDDAERDVWVVDRFRSSPDPDRAPTWPARGVSAMRPDLNLVRDGFERFDALDDRVHFLQGRPDEALGDAGIDAVAVLRIGRTAADDAGSILDRLYDAVSVGGSIIVDAPAGSDARRALDEFRDRRGITTPLLAVDGSAVAWERVADEAVAPTARGATGGASLPLAPPAPAGSVDLTVVVVFHDMRREAERTLLSLSRAYQEDIDDLTYEVLAIENGSRADQRLGPEFVARFGPEFRYVDMGADASPSPVPALNRGIREGRGKAYALMIDGAHVLTPGVLHFGLAGLRTYAPAIVATQQWYVGPGQQGEAMAHGYDRGYEDELFERIKWPTAGHRLFEIGHFVGDRDWLDGLWESNCMFVSRAQLRQVGGFDEHFAEPGGGYANLELYERLGSSPDVTVCSILGEGSFHQTHGGTTTNQPDVAERRARVFGYSQSYADLRGRPFRGPGKPVHFVGRLPNGASRRSKPRRMSTDVFAEVASALDGPPSAPAPVPDELRWAFTDAVWRSLPWRDTTWAGRSVATAPTDLVAYQQIVDRVRPDWIVETGTGDGGRALFLASICEMVGHGRVLSVDGSAPTEGDDPRPRHPRLQYLSGAPDSTETAGAVTATVGADARAVVVIGTAASREETARQFERYAPLVPVGSYVVVTDTVVNGHPVWPAFGPGPAEAVKQVLGGHGEFVQDTSMEKYSLSFNPGGYLRRVR